MRVEWGYKPFQWQLDVHKCIAEHPKSSIITVKSSRQKGKSVMLQNILLKAALTVNKSTSIGVSPTLEQARKLYKEILNATEGTPLLKRHNDVRLELEFYNKSIITFKSAEQRESLRGYTVTGILVIDEAAYISDDIQALVLPWVNVSKVPIVVVSTPFIRKGFFYDYYINGKNNVKNFYSFDWCDYDTSALLDEEQLEIFRKTLPMQKFVTEYLGQFMDLKGSVFGDFKDIVKNPEHKSNCVMGIDWATGQNQDETAISIMNYDKEQIFCTGFNDKDETETITYIVEIIKQYKPLKVLVETNSIGEVFYGLLKKAVASSGTNTQVIGFTTTNDSKQRLVNKLQVAIQNKTHTILDDKTQLEELAVYEMKLSPTGKPTYNAPNGYHDDRVIALLLSMQALNSGGTDFYFVN